MGRDKAEDARSGMRLNAKEAAHYIGIEKEEFLELVRDGQGPRSSVDRHGEVTWRLRDIDAWFDDLPEDNVTLH